MEDCKAGIKKAGLPELTDKWDAMSHDTK